jgi:hypothetical protein
MLWLVDWGFHLVFSPLHHKIDQCLRLDGRPRLEIEGEGPQFHCPVGDAPGGVPIVEDIHQWQVNDYQDVVCIKIMVKLPGGEEYIVE